MGSKIYLSSPATTPTALTQDLYINNVNVGAVSYQSPIFVNLQDGSATPVTPISVSKPANVATVTLPTPAPSGVALQRPIGDQFISYNTGDTGWRVQNGWFYYTPPSYPAKFARLKNTVTSEYWYTLQTALTVNGVTSTQRFVDVSGVQSWSALNNLNLSVIDKLTGLMFTRTRSGLSRNWYDSIADGIAYSVTINGITFSDWYLSSLQEVVSFFGNYATSPTWTDPVSSQVIYQFQNSATFPLSDTKNTGYFDQCTSGFINTTNRDLQFGIGSKPTNFNTQIFVHDVSNLIS